MKSSRTIHTSDGSSVSITPRGILYDLHVRNAAGATVATVVMNSDALDALVDEAEEVR
ncbi:hypothetical protein [Streptomyces umbrinus]|uniref:hypothetical protein n=1 Tax=Streptomyces umbrinus TaxID=67370 RepID=UPI0034301324